MNKSATIIARSLSALVIACAMLAVFSYPAGAQTAKKLKCNGCVKSKQIKNSGIKGADIKNNTIGGSKIQNGAIDGSKIQDGAIDGSKIASGAVGTDEIEDVGVTTAKIADDAVTADKLAPGAVDLISLGLAGALCPSGEVLIGFDPAGGIVCASLGMATCGNGVIEVGELCDDGNTAPGDGCGGMCVIEIGYVCTGIPSVCVLKNPIPDLAGDLVITEIMANPSAVVDSEGEWFEVMNPTGTDFGLLDLVFRDDGSDSFTVDSELVIPAGGFLVFGRNGDPGVNGGVAVDFVYSGMTLANSIDEIEIFNSAASVVIDRVAYDVTTFPVGNGAAMSLDPSADDVTNNLASSWCPATDVLPQGDFGSPGAMNPTCP